MAAPNDRRRAALDDARARHPAVAARFLETHGLTLSQQVMLLAAFFQGLDDTERAALRGLGLQPVGAATWYSDAGIARTPKLDARLHYRYRRDPPELVTVLTGESDGLHFGFLHDEPTKVPWLLVSNYARELGESVAASGSRRTVIDFLRQLVTRALREGQSVEPLVAVVDELAAAGEEVLAAELKAHPKKTVHRLRTLGGPGPIVPPKQISPTPLPGPASRKEAYASPARAAELVAAARAELARGFPALALLVGQDLFWLGAMLQEEAVQLLEAGYGALGRDALGAIARLHHAHRDLASVDVY